jgi:hypothetical protein
MSVLEERHVRQITEYRLAAAMIHEPRMLSACEI